ncbi:MAG: TetR/AcrR family transcriptional regulator [Candidatus Viridilinea halotolerans]|uniref:TetR/AcrR family transcriptional regulator n=1 Tax=Candidatus Viridilinea halotolerans TaxID=2491704 RepID=A0A426U1T2_9CHLR|nr:MAG: TetR/AcrR family transcriptional regulator [Candidatus Viridilinea halotolerans]
MTQSLRTRRRATLRDEILAATHQLMTERGYAAMSMDDIAARVGVSKPTLYNQFPTKDDLVATLINQVIERVFAHLEAIHATPPLERLLDVLHTTIKIQVEHRTSSIQLWMPDIIAILERNPTSRALLMRVDACLVATIEEAQALGQIDPNLDVASVLRSFNALTLTPNIGQFSTCTPTDPQRLADDAVAIFRRGVTPAQERVEH